MYLRLKDKAPAAPVLQEAGCLLNHAKVFVKQTEYDVNKQALYLKLTRFPVIKKTALSRTKHSRQAVDCEVVIRNVVQCDIENITGELEQVTIIFGLHFDQHRIYFCSAEEDRGQPCYAVDCKVSEFDLEIMDISVFAGQ